MSSDVTKTLARILIVEDNADDEVLLLRQLKKARLDKQVRIISEGSRARDYLLDERLHAQDLVAIFLDLKLPGVSGLELLEIIRSTPRLTHLPVILMTSSNAPEEIDQCHTLGVTAFVRKPVTFSAFSKAVADCIDLTGNSLSDTSRLSLVVE